MMSFNKNGVFSVRWAAISGQKSVTERRKRRRIVWFCEKIWQIYALLPLCIVSRILFRSTLSETCSGYITSVPSILIFYGLSNNAGSNSDYVALNGRIISKTVEIFAKMGWEKQDIPCLRRDFNRLLAERKSDMLLFETAYLVSSLFECLIDSIPNYFQNLIKLGTMEGYACIIFMLIFANRPPLATDPEVQVRFPVLPDFWEVVCLKRGQLSLVSTIEELLERESSDSGLENRKYGRKDSSRRPCDLLYPQKLVLTSPTSGSRSIGIFR
jgi:hypothetical protein